MWLDLMVIDCWTISMMSEMMAKMMTETMVHRGVTRREPRRRHSTLERWGCHHSSPPGSRHLRESNDVATGL